jgi:hypothetical protein
MNLEAHRVSNSPLAIPQTSTSLSLQPPNSTHKAHKALTMASTNAYPPGGIFLDTLKKSFSDVPINKEKDNAIATTEFLEAAESLTTLFGTNSQFTFRFQNTNLWQMSSDPELSLP